MTAFGKEFHGFIWDFNLDQMAISIMNELAIVELSIPNSRLNEFFCSEPLESRIPRQRLVFHCVLEFLFTHCTIEKHNF